LLVNARCLFYLALPLALAGCSTHNHSYVRDTLARLPNGDEITCIEAVDKMSDRQYTDTSLQWRRLAPTETLVQIQGQGEVRVKEAGKVLTVQGEPYVQTGRSVYYDNTHYQMTPDQIERARRWQEMIAHSQTRVSPDGNHVWLQYQGRTFASFDYDQAIAVFGEQNQPTWAASADAN
jgi:hypothetical protein